MKILYLITLIALILFSGCIGSNSSTNELKPEEIGDGIDFSIVNVLHMQDCNGISATQFYPTTMNPAPVPEGWPNNTEGPLTAVAILAWTCEFIGLNGLERSGTILWEYASSGVPPPACFKDAGGPLGHVTNILADDAEIVRILRNQYGASAHLTEFEVEETANSQSWTWDVDGSTSTFLTLQEKTSEPRDKLPNRWVWPSVNGTAVLDLTFQVESLQFTNRVGVAEFNEPLYMETVAGHFVGATNVDRNASLTGKFDLRDAQCE